MSFNHGMSFNLIMFLTLSKDTLGRAFVIISAGMFSVPQYLTHAMLPFTCSLMK